MTDRRKGAPTREPRRARPRGGTSAGARAGRAAIPFHPPTDADARLGLGACLAVMACAFAFSWRRLGDFDTWWHLASGRSIAAHHAVPTTDTLSHTVRDHAWVNVQWAFDLGLYALHRLGGPVLLTLAGAVIFTSAIGLVLLLVVARLGRSLGALLVLVVILTAQERILMRPELLSFLLLAGVLVVLERGRGPEGRTLWLLVPLMLVWANVHALFVIGVFAILCALLGTGTAPSRKLLTWGTAALVSVVVNPYGLTGVLFPLKLVSRINGSSAVFATVGEFASPFAPGATDLTAVLYKIDLAVSLAAILAAIVVTGRWRGPRTTRPQMDWGGLVFFAGLAVVSAAARRNIALFAIGTAPCVAGCLAIALRPWSGGAQRLAGRAPLLAFGTTAGALLLASTVLTGAFYRSNREPQEFGGGVLDGFFPVRAAAFARAAALPPTLYTDMLGGGYFTWDEPVGGGVFVDGRLEVYDTAFLSDYVAAMNDSSRWQAEADRYGVNTVILCHRYEAERVLVGQLVHGTVWSLVYLDEVAAVLVRHAGHADVLARAAALRPAWDARTAAWLAAAASPRPYAAGRAEGTRAYARALATVGSADGAVRAYLKLLELGIVADDEIQIRLLLARHFASVGQTAEAQDQARHILALDPHQVEAQALVR